jgi:quercetin dioxygenase-like cupin family protein
MTPARTGNGLLVTAVAAVVVSCGAPAAQPQTGSAPVHPSETLTPMLAQTLPNIPGKTFTSAIVTFPPAARAVPHRHGDAFVYAYVLEGAVSSQLEGQPVRMYREGQNWSEPPGAHHLVTENASETEEAKLLVVFVASTGEELKIDDPTAERSAG